MPKETKDIAAAGGIGNLSLYRMCDQWPLHVDRDHVIDKMLFIARSYSAARNLGGRWKAMAKALINEADKIDGAIAQLRVARFPQCLPAAVALHSMVDKAVCDALRRKGAIKTIDPKGGSRASFVSKYLHFHAPDAIPILDSLAKEGLRSSTDGFKTKLNRPSDYARYCERLAHLIKSKGIGNESLRSIDTRLVADGRKAKKAAEKRRASKKAAEQQGK